MFDRKEYAKRYYQENKERITPPKYDPLKYQANKEKVDSYHKKYIGKNPLWVVYTGMKQRCYNPKSTSYKNYGGRGIKVCNLWLNDFKAFEEWCLANGYKLGLQIDRVNNDGDYDPSNCIFSTPAQNVAIGRRRKNSNNKCGYTGVFFNSGKNKYQASLMVGGKKIYCGHHDTAEEAAQARINKEIELFGKQLTNL